MIDESIQGSNEDHASIQTCLHVFAALGQLENCKTFVERYGSTYVNHHDCLGWTPLMYSARFGHLDITNFLHSVGASLKSKNIFDYTPLCMAVASNSQEVFEYIMAELRKLSDLKDETVAFELACVLGRTEFLKSFVSSLQFDVNNIQCSIPDINPLLLTVYSGSVEAVEFLLASGAKQSLADDSCPSALDIAQYNQDAKMQALFVKEKLTSCLTPTLLTPSIDVENLVFNFSTPPYNLEESGGYRLLNSPKRRLDRIDCDFHRLDGLLSPRFLKPDEHRKWLGSIENKTNKNVKESKMSSCRKYVMWMSQKINNRRTKSVNDLCDDKSKENLDEMERSDCIVTHILTELKLEKYITKFRRNEIDHLTMFTLTEDDLITMGIAKKRERKNILETLEKYKIQVQDKLQSTSDIDNLQ